jgi:DNA mismatch endonuclease (patch repair protein)
VHGSDPKANSDWWRTKLDANVARDRRNDVALEATGWKILRFWTHQAVEEMVDEVLKAIKQSRAQT